MDSKLRVPVNDFFLLIFGTYITIGLITALTMLFSAVMVLPEFIAYFFAFFITALFVRSYYEQLVLYKLSIKNISFTKNIIMAIVSAVSMAAIFYFIRQPLGYFGIPIATFLGQIIIEETKAYIWPEIKQSAAVAYRSKQFNLYITGIGVFYVILALVSYIGFYYDLLSFPVAFALGSALAVMFGAIFETVLVKQISITKKRVLWGALISIVLGITASSLAIILMALKLPDATATIFAAIIVKTVQSIITLKL